VFLSFFLSSSILVFYVVVDMQVVVAIIVKPISGPLQNEVKSAKAKKETNNRNGTICSNIPSVYVRSHVHHNRHVSLKERSTRNKRQIKTKKRSDTKLSESNEDNRQTESSERRQVGNMKEKRKNRSN
jgi:hypothetical protein